MFSYMPIEQSYLNHVHKRGWLKGTVIIATVSLLLCVVGGGGVEGLKERRSHRRRLSVL